jgi:TRAP-type C4-dicarboxylate transport system permease large subunit
MAEGGHGAAAHGICQCAGRHGPHPRRTFGCQCPRHDVPCFVLAYRNGHPRGESVPLREAVKIAIDAFWGLVTLAIILGGILGGVFTAIEAGAVACLWAFFVTMFIYRDYRWRDLPQLIHRTMRTVAMVMTLIAFASSVGYVMALMQVPARVTALLLTLSSDKNVILLLINVLLWCSVASWTWHRRS